MHGFRQCLFITAPLLCLLFLWPSYGRAQAPAREIDILYRGFPASPTERSLRISLVAHILDVLSMGNGVLAEGDRIIFNHENMADVSRLVRLLDGKGTFERQPLGSVAAIDSPYELAFQLDHGTGDVEGKGPDLIAKMLEINRETKMFPDMHESEVQLVRYVNEKGDELFAVELSDMSDKPLGAAPGDYELLFGLSVEIDIKGQKGVIINIGKPMNDLARSVKLTKDLKKKIGEAGLIHLSVGSMLPRKIDYLNFSAHIEKLTSMVIELTKTLGYDAILPTEKELLLEKDITTLSSKHKLPYLSANLFFKPKKGKDPKRVFPAYRTFELGSKKVMVLGLSRSSLLKDLDPEIRETFHVMSIEKALQKLEDGPRKKLKPDLVVVLTDAAGEELKDIENRAGLDIVLGDFSKLDLVQGETVMVFDEHYSPTVDRAASSFLRVHASHGSIGHIKVVFEGDVLAKVTHKNHNVRWDLEPDAGIHSLIQKTLINNRLEFGKIWLPDISDYIDEDSELAPLIWGEAIMSKGKSDKYLENYPARFSDSLWMRFVTNVLYEETRANVVFCRNLPRNFNPIGPISRYYINDMLNVSDAIWTVGVTGKELKKLLAFVKSQLAAGEEDSHIIFVAGADPGSKIVEGRSLDETERYLIAISDYLADIPVFSDVLKKKKIKKKFVRGKKGYKPDKKGETLLLRDVILEELTSYLDDKTQEFDESKKDAFLKKFKARHEKVRPRWLLDIKKVGFSFSSYGAYNNKAYGASTESRVVTPGSYTFGGDLDLSLEYDDAWVDWENRLKLGYQKKMVTQDGEEIASENVDDIVVSTELRIKALKFPVARGTKAFLQPFGNLVYDTEFTPTVDTDTGEENPLQKVIFSNVGLNWKSEKYLKKFYVSFLMKNDFAVERGSFESGVGAGFLLEIPYKWFKFTSELTMRYFPPHENDTIEDLGFTVSFVNVFMFEIYKGIRFHFTADYFLFKGKVPETDHPGLSLILSGGISFSRLFVGNM